VEDKFQTKITDFFVNRQMHKMDGNVILLALPFDDEAQKILKDGLELFVYSCTPPAVFRKNISTLEAYMRGTVLPYFIRKYETPCTIIDSLKLGFAEKVDIEKEDQKKFNITPCRTKEKVNKNLSMLIYSGIWISVRRHLTPFRSSFSEYILNESNSYDCALRNTGVQLCVNIYITAGYRLYKFEDLYTLVLFSRTPIRCTSPLADIYNHYGEHDLKDTLKIFKIFKLNKPPHRSFYVSSNDIKTYDEVKEDVTWNIIKSLFLITPEKYKQFIKCVPISLRLRESLEYAYLPLDVLVPVITLKEAKFLDVIGERVSLSKLIHNLSVANPDERIKRVNKLKNLLLENGVKLGETILSFRDDLLNAGEEAELL